MNDRDYLVKEIGEARKHLSKLVEMSARCPDLLNKEIPENRAIIAEMEKELNAPVEQHQKVNTI